MKKLLAHIIKQVVNFFLSIFSFQFFQNLDVIKSTCYTLWISKQFKEFGNNSGVNIPMYLAGGEYISIGNNFHCDHRLRLDAIDSYNNQVFTPSIAIGDNVIIQKDCHIGAVNSIVIGNNVLLASKVYISDHSHGEITKEDLLLPPVKRKLFSKGPVIIEDNVWLGEGVVVLPNVIIGKNSIVGANAVVTKSIPENSVAAGNPARIIKTII